MKKTVAITSTIAAIAIGGIYLRINNAVDRIQKDAFDLQRVTLLVCKNTDTAAFHRFNTRADTTIDWKLVPCLDSLTNQAIYYHRTLRITPMYASNNNFSMLVQH